MDSRRYVPRTDLLLADPRLAPGLELDSAAVSLPESLAVPLRRGEPAVVGRLEQGRLLLDLRSVSPADDPHLTAAVATAAGTRLS